MCTRQSFCSKDMILVRTIIIWYHYQCKYIKHFNLQSAFWYLPIYPISFPSTNVFCIKHKTQNLFYSVYQCNIICSNNISFIEQQNKIQYKEQFRSVLVNANSLSLSLSLSFSLSLYYMIVFDKLNNIRKIEHKVSTKSLNYTNIERQIIIKDKHMY